MKESAASHETAEALDEAVERAVVILKNGGVVALPTDTIYGLACSPFREEAVARIFDIKGRPQDTPLPLLLASVEYVYKYVTEVPEEGTALMDKFFPGALTLVLPKRPEVPGIVTGGRDSVAVRVPDHPVPRRIAGKLDGAITGTSANRSGDPGITTARAVEAALGNDVDMVVDGGETPGGVESTVVDLTGSEPTILRLGAVSRELVEAACGRPVRLAR